MQKETYSFFINIPYPYRRLDYVKRAAGFMMEAHSHNYFQVIAVTSGTLTVNYDGQNRNLTEGFVHVLPAGFTHRLSSDTGYSQCGIDIFIEDSSDDIVRMFLASFKQPNVYGASELLKYTNIITCRIENADLLSSKIVKSSLDLILLSLMEIQNNNGLLPFSNRLSDYLDINLSENQTLGKIAADFYISVSHLERLCKRHFGIGVKTLQNRKRFESACKYLVTTTKPVSEIAELTGFNEVSNFSAFFKRNAGMPPLTYRNEYKLR